jgi:hypothetical protein
VSGGGEVLGLMVVEVIGINLIDISYGKEEVY